MKAITPRYDTSTPLTRPQSEPDDEADADRERHEAGLLRVARERGRGQDAPP